MAVFPTINSYAVMFQLPFQETDEFVTHVADLDCGFSYTESQNEQPLKRWTLQYPAIDLDELDVLEDFFDEMNGSLGEFEFTDSRGTLHTKTRFAENAFTVNYPEPGRVSVTMKLLAQP